MDTSRAPIPRSLRAVVLLRQRALSQPLDDRRGHPQRNQNPTRPAKTQFRIRRLVPCRQQTKPPPPSALRLWVLKAFRAGGKKCKQRHAALARVLRTYAPTNSLFSLGSYSTMYPATALAATVNGDARYICPGPLRPGKFRFCALMTI